MSTILYGINVVEEFLKHRAMDILNVYLLKKHCNNRLLILEKKIKKYNIPICLVDKKFLDRKSHGEKNQGIIILIKDIILLTEKDLLRILKNKIISLLLILDCISDTRNLGSCLRCAEAAGVDAVIITKNRSAKLTNISRKIANGAAEIVPIIQIINLSRVISILKEHNIKIVGTDIYSKNTIFNSIFTDPVAIIVGSEQSGIRSLTKKCCDELVKIPMFGSISSLNTAVATGIILFEVKRQRLLKSI